MLDALYIVKDVTLEKHADVGKIYCHYVVNTFLKSMLQMHLKHCKIIRNHYRKQVICQQAAPDSSIFGLKKKNCVDH